MAMSDPEPRGWQVGKSLKQCFGLLLENQNMCDVTFNITPDDAPPQKLHAHRVILSARSPVFEAMFSGKFAEEATDVSIVDAEADIFSELLRYIYSEEVTLTGDNVLYLLYLARKYMLEGLVDECSKFLKDNITPDNVSEILTHSVEHAADTIIDDCLKVAWSKPRGMFQAPSFMKMSRNALKRFLTSDTAAYDYNGSCPESEILQAVLKWAEHQTNLDNTQTMRECLGDCIYAIRFASLTSKELTKNLRKSSAMTDTEIIKWYNYLSDPEDDEISKELHNMSFDTTPRCKLYVVQRGIRLNIDIRRAILFHSGVGGGIFNESYNFTSNTAISLCQFGVYGGSTGRQSDITITVQDSTSQMFQSCKTTFTSDGTNRIYSVSPAKPINILPGRSYTISAKITSTDYISQPVSHQFNVNNIQISTSQTQWVQGQGNCTIISEFTFKC